MLIFIVLFILWLLGYFIVSSLVKNINLVLKSGLALLIGIGLQGVFMLLFDLIHIPITLVTLLSFSLVLTLILWFKSKGVFLADLNNIRRNIPGPGQLNFAWIFFFCVIIYVLYGLAMKGIYWPTTEYDSVTGYDFMGKMIATEKVLRVSMFEHSTNALVVPRFIYPPLVAGGYALQYMCGPETLKLIPISFFIGLLLGFYGGVRYFTTHTGAIVATAFLCVTPEMCSHAALSLTNMPNAAYASISLIVLYLYILKDNISWLYLSAVMMALTIFTRSDSVVFSAAGMGVLFYLSLKKKNFKPFILYFFIANSLFISWTLYLKFVLHSNSADFLEKTLFWDPDRISSIMTYVGDFMVWDTQLFGLGFWLLFLFIALNLRILKRDLSYFLVLAITSWVLYTSIYYQMNYIQAPLDTFMKASYKRGIFCFVPLAWFYIICNKKSVWIFERIDQFLYH